MAEETFLVLQGGLKITSPFVGGKLMATGGTLGCFAREKTGKKRYLILTNQHVVNLNSSDLPNTKGRRICFESYTDCEDTFGCRSCSRVIARVLDNEYDNKLDAAIVALKPSWGGGNRIKFKAELTDGVEFASPLPITGTLDLRGKPDSFFSQTPFQVMKFGDTTKKTAGRILTADYPNANFPRDTGASEGGVSTGREPIEQILVEADAPFPRFADHGDSGSVVVTPDGKVVALLYAISGSNPKRAYAAHIGDVVERFDIEILTTSSAPGETIVPEDNMADVPDNPAKALGAPALSRLVTARGILEESLPGQELLAIVDRHEAEILRLAGEKLRLKAAWRRYGGYELGWELLTAICEPDHRLPPLIGGRPLPDSVRGISRQVRRYASPALQRDLDQCEALTTTFVGRRWQEIVSASSSPPGILGG